MLHELTSQQLTVVLVPSRRRDARPHDMIRCVVDRNPLWYRKLCGRHHSTRVRGSRKPDTKIRRQDTIRALEQLVEGRRISRYCDELLAEAQARYDALEEAPF